MVNMVKIDTATLMASGEAWWNKLMNFDFTASNPLFWVILFVVFLILSQPWPARKAASFCLVSGGILLLATWTEKLIRKNIGSFDPLLVRTLFLVFLGFVCFYYVMIKNDE